MLKPQEGYIAYSATNITVYDNIDISGQYPGRKGLERVRQWLL
jgi:hypothetical protein